MFIAIPSATKMGRVYTGIRLSVYRLSNIQALIIFYLDSPYNSWTTHRTRISLLTLGSKGQSNKMVSGLESVLPRVTVLHIWITHGMKVIPKAFEVKRLKRSKVKCTENSMK
jgi:hypothetical protein